MIAQKLAGLSHSEMQCRWIDFQHLAAGTNASKLHIRCGARGDHHANTRGWQGEQLLDNFQYLRILNHLEPVQHKHQGVITIG
ncbi:hypothetical protein D3C76_759410 [compost metagenome]